MPFADLMNCHIHYELNPGAQGPVVLFANSLGTVGELWADQISCFRSERSTLCYDMRGHGRSRPNPAEPTIDTLVDEALKVMDAVGVEQVDFVGISLGGLIGQRLALRCPDRVRSLVLCATSHAFRPSEMWRERAAKVREKGVGPMVEVSRLRWFTPKVIEERSVQVQLLLDALADVDAESYAQCCEVLAETDLSNELGSVKIPTLLISGKDDHATPTAMLKAIEDLIAGARLMEISGAAHLVNVNQPALFNEALRLFWRSLS